MLSPNQTTLTENSRKVVLLEKRLEPPRTFLKSFPVPEIVVIAENYDDPNLPQHPFLFHTPTPLKVFAKKDRTMIIPIINFSPTYLMWFCLVKTCEAFKEKFKLLERYCSPDLVVVLTENCEAKNLAKKFNATIRDEFTEPAGSTLLDRKFDEIVFINGKFYRIS